MKFLRNFIKWVHAHRRLSSLLALLLIGGAIFFRWIQTRSSGMLSEPLTQGKIIQAVYGIGTVMANRSFQFKFGVVSTLYGVYVKEGDSVRKGQPLVKVETVTYRAPFSGTVTSLPFKVGENIFSNIPILTLVDLEDRYLLVSLEQQGALRVRRGQKVKMSFDTLREQSYEGEVQSVYSNENNFLARIDIGKLPESILPGMTADVAISIETHPNSILVPIAALEKGNRVWRKRGHSIPTPIAIQVGIVDQSVAELVSGDLQPGDRLLIRKNIKP